MNGTDPFRIFRRWYQETRDCGNPDPSVITLATATAGGKPSARTVLLKEFDAGGFVFYTNYGSRPVPDRIEFWVDRENRLHDRVVYERKSAEGKMRWVSRRLAP